jgi:arsenate reductase
MSEIIIYHNPKCSKSRQTLELIKNQNLQPKIVLYLDEKLSKEKLKDIISKLGIKTRDLLRKNENDYKENNLDNPNLTNEELIELILNFPKLMERPIVVKGEQAVIGRPPENVLELILRGE